MNEELAQLRMELSQMRMELGNVRRELSVAQRAIKLIRPHLFTSDEDSSGVGNLILVNVTQTSGSAGNRTTECTFAYTVKTVDNTTIGTSIGITGHGNRVAKAAMLAGTHGIAYWAGTGSTPVLLWVDERLTQNNC